MIFDQPKQLTVHVDSDFDHQVAPNPQLLENLEAELAEKRAEIALSVKTRSTEALKTQLIELRDLYKTYLQASRKKRRKLVQPISRSGSNRV